MSKIKLNHHMDKKNIADFNHSFIPPFKSVETTY